ncbi:MAG: hypothetical protein HQM16_09090 [Deltaproteobacteria bacterium]|nr:hypothetical protein [Deltaproteobacteria bacterium]
MGEHEPITGNLTPPLPPPFQTDTSRDSSCEEQTPSLKRQDSFIELSAIAERFFKQMSGYRGLAASGLNAVFGPLVDVAPPDKASRERAHMWQRGRVHTWNPEVASFFAGLAIQAARVDDRPVFSFIKHAPGIGSIEAKTIEMGDSLVTDTRTYGEIANNFRSFETTLRQFDNGVGVMVAGVAVPALDKGDQKVLPPAALSPKVVSWMRKRLGQDVLLITDDANSPSFRAYIKGKIEKESKNALERREQKVAMLLYLSVKADIDIILFCDSDFPDKAASRLISAGRRLIKERRITRKELIPSVRRILKAKQAMYPDNPRLADVDALIDGMTNDELWAQKLLLMTYDEGNLSASASRAVELGIGGLSTEATQAKRNDLKKIVDEKVAQGAIPVFIADNSPQELPGYDNKANRAELGAWQLIRKFTTAYDRLFPEGASECFFSVMRDEATATSP